MKCRHCSAELNHTFIDLGSSPPSNSYLNVATMKAPEKWYPLRVLVCDQCWLVQTEDFVGASEMFSEDYAYFSSYSTTWVKHASDYVDAMVERFSLGSESNIVEVAGNDGYLLQFVKQKNIPCYSIEPTHSTAVAAREKGIETIEAFFGEEKAQELASQNRQADLTVANNVLAHVPDINDFVKGFSILLKPDGVATFEFPHLLNLVRQNQFDTIYHEHYSYLSLTAVQTIFLANGLTIFDVEKLPTHGGSLRIFAQRSNAGNFNISENVIEIQELERHAGMRDFSFYGGFQNKAKKIKIDLLSFILESMRNGKNIAAYGAAAKGNTLLNYAGVSSELISYVVDLNPSKQDKYMPGSRIPIVDEEKLKSDQPDFVLILPWNLHTEITTQLNYIKDWGGKFVMAVPELVIE